MNKTTARNLVAGVWFLLFIISLAIPLWMYAAGWLGDEWLGNVLGEINRLYVPYVGALVTFYFAVSKEKKQPIPATAAVLAVACALLWNAFNLYFLIALSLGRIEADAAIRGMDKYCGLLSWIVAPSMGFFFGSHFHAPAARSEQSQARHAAAGER